MKPSMWMFPGRGLKQQAVIVSLFFGANAAVFVCVQRYLRTQDTGTKEALFYSTFYVSTLVLIWAMWNHYHFWKHLDAARGWCCTTCGYDLTGTVTEGNIDCGICAECGKPFSIAENRRVWKLTRADDPHSKPSRNPFVYALPWLVLFPLLTLYMRMDSLVPARHQQWVTTIVIAAVVALLVWMILRNLQFSRHK